MPPTPRRDPPERREDESLHSRPRHRCHRANRLAHLPDERSRALLVEHVEKQPTHRAEQPRVLMRVDERRGPTDEIKKSPILRRKLGRDFHGPQPARQDAAQEAAEWPKPDRK